MSDEDDFLTAIRAAPADDLLRLVYADWLDERSRAGGAFLRAECEFVTLTSTDPRRDAVQARMRDAGVGVDPGWLAEVSRVPVEGCGITFRFRCPKKWEQLQPTSEEGVRHCGQCRQRVYFCSSIDVARTHAALGDCLAVDPRLTRTPQDLESWWEADDLFMGMPADEVADPKDEEPPPPRGRR